MAEFETEQLSDRIRKLETAEDPVVFDSYTGAVSTPPSAAQINAAFGGTAAQLRDGWAGVIDDTVNGNTWLAISENDNWRVLGAASIGPITGVGISPEVAYWTAATVLGGDPSFTYDAVNDIIQITPAVHGGLDMLGPTGANRIRVLDNLADALHINDAGDASDYLTIVSANAQRQVVFNEDQADIDFRVESDNYTHLLFGDAGNNRVIIGGNAGTDEALRVIGGTASSLGTTRTLRTELITAGTTGYGSSYILKTRSTGNMADTFGGGIVFSIEDNALVENFIATIYAERNGADNSGAITLNTYNAGVRSQAVWIGANQRVFIGTGTNPSAQCHIDQASPTGAIPVLLLDQGDQDVPFLNWVGTSAADQTKSISTVNGDGVVDGPKNFSTSAGWTFAGMVLVQVNGNDKWMPYYDPQTS